MDLLQTS